MDTIFAQATASGRAGVSIIRLSGVQALSIASEFCNVPVTGRSGLRFVRAADGSLIDRALVLFFEAGASFTGEQVIEFHVHGGLATVAKLLAELSEFDGCRLANPGQAICVLEGSFGELGEVWRADLLRAVALIEASIDFSDEEIPDDLYLEVAELVGKTSASVSSVLDRSSIAVKIRSGFTVAIVGTPNVGKSTLLNAIAGRQAAITSDVAGTTRDVIEIRVDLKGLAVTFLDTAGLHVSNDPIEKLGISMAYKRSDAADVRIFLVERDTEALPFPARSSDFVVLNKSDLGVKDGLSVSGKTGEGVSELLDLIAESLLKKTSLDVVAIRERQVKGLNAANTLLLNVIALTEQKPLPFELASQELYFALTELDFVFGKIDIENVLDEIFSSFCLGK